MTVEYTITKKLYKGNGLATEFPVPFAYSRAGDLHLPHVSADDVETPSKTPQKTLKRQKSLLGETKEICI